MGDRLEVHRGITGNRFGKYLAAHMLNAPVAQQNVSPVIVHRRVGYDRLGVGLIFSGADIHVALAGLWIDNDFVRAAQFRLHFIKGIWILIRVITGVNPHGYADLL